MTGYNHNIPYQGRVYHVQTEFFSTLEPHIETHVFDNGKVLGALRKEVALEEDDGNVAVLAAMKAQQKEMIRELISGRLTDTAATEAALEAESPGGYVPWMEGAAEQLMGDAGDLHWRRCLIRFTRSVDPRNVPAPSEVPARLRTIMTSLAVLTGSMPRGFARSDELADLLIVRSECLEWLSQGLTALEMEGIRLWRGFARLAAAFDGLNDRRHLIDHDVQVWHRLLDQLDELDDTDRLDSALLESLKSTWGRDVLLDEQMEFPGSLRVGGLRKDLRRALGDAEDSLADLDGDQVSVRRAG